MTTKSTRNISFEQANAMWPGITFSENEQFTVTSVANDAKPPFSFYYPVATTADVTVNNVDSLRPERSATRWDANVTYLPSPDNVTVPAETIRKIQEQFDPKQAVLDKMKTEAVKADSGKPDWSLVPFEALEGMVRVLEFGANKYSRNNWMTSGGFSYRRVLTACVRHIFSYLTGEDKDPESGLSHIHHAQCNLLFIAMYLTNKEKFNKDDRESR